MNPTFHVITHTHWDREWFLPAVYVNEWLDDLFERLFVLLESVPAYRFILDGQTMILEDYLGKRPNKRADIERYAAAGNLLLGPYYGQLDWRTVSEEALFRNLFFGMEDARRLGNLMSHGWIVDNFGHCAQSPQIHQAFGIDTVTLWRGPVLPNDNLTSPIRWRGPDGSEVLVHFLVSGYRNFYNLTDTIEYVQERIEQLVRMLAPSTPHGQFVFLNGYDTDAWPEEPFLHLNATEPFLRSTPKQLTSAIRDLGADQPSPVLTGELYSGKYACVFPGTLSARTYLRVQNALIERLLTLYVEPLTALTAQARSESYRRQIETAWRDMLKVHLHDNIGGVSVDQVHDNMETVYRRLHETARNLVVQGLEHLAGSFGLAPGRYAFVPTPFRHDSIWLHGEHASYRTQPSGAGIHSIAETADIPAEPEPVGRLDWSNDYYSFEISSEAALLNGRPVGELVLEQDRGDTYNADPQPIAPVPIAETVHLEIEHQTEDFLRISLSRQLVWGEVSIETNEEIILDQTPLVRWRIEADTGGTGYRLRAAYRTSDQESQVLAKMPFSIDQRPRRDTNYFGADIPDELKPVLLAAREVHGVDDFPMQGFVALTDGNRSRAILARGLREYQADAEGAILVTLKRSVEWLAKTDLTTRVGDAGPYMYVPGARDERATRFDLAFLDIPQPVRSPEFMKWFYLFENDFLVFDHAEANGDRTEITFWEEPLPWSGVQILPSGQAVLRTYNPLETPVRLAKAMTAVNPFGEDPVPVESLEPNQIVSLLLVGLQAAEEPGPTAGGTISLVEFPIWPSGPDRSIVEERRLSELAALAERKRMEQNALKETSKTISEDENPLQFHRHKHAVIRLEREILEAEVSILLNKSKQAPEDGALQERIRNVGKQLNLVRRKRRTYDYILSLYENRANP